MDVGCPYCGETITVFIDAGGGHSQRYVEDCSVCCRPIEISVDGIGGGEVHIGASRTDE